MKQSLQRLRFLNICKNLIWILLGFRFGFLLKKPSQKTIKDNLSLDWSGFPNSLTPFTGEYQIFLKIILAQTAPLNWMPREKAVYMKWCSWERRNNSNGLSNSGTCSEFEFIEDLRFWLSYTYKESFPPLWQWHCVWAYECHKQIIPNLFTITFLKFTLRIWLIMNTIILKIKIMVVNYNKRKLYLHLHTSLPLLFLHHFTPFLTRQWKWLSNPYPLIWYYILAY